MRKNKTNDSYFNDEYLSGKKYKESTEKSTFIIDENGNRQGDFVNYHSETGSIWRIGTYKDDEYDGLIYSYNENGSLQSIKLYIDGEEVKSKEEIKKYMVKLRYEQK